MHRTRSGPRARIGGYLISMVLSGLLVACTPMADRGVPPLFPTRTPAVSSATVTVTLTPTLPAIPTTLPTLAQTPHPLAQATMAAPAMAWLDRASLTGDVTTDEEWEPIRRAARTEGHVVLYSDTARMLTALESFLLVNPGLDGEVRVLTSDDALSDLMQPPQEPGTLNADVYLGGDGPLAMQALAQNQLFNYVPADVRQTIPASMREPLLVHHWSAVFLVQRGAGAQAPIDNWWDLTREEWRGQVAFPDPAINKRSMYLLLAFAQHAEDLRQAYRTEFGRELVLDEACPDAACQWITLFLRNDPKVLASDADVAAWVSDASATGTRLGVCGSEQLAKVQRGKVALSPLSNVTPTAGLFWPTFLAMVVGGQHPNAAQVIIHWLMSDTTGDGALAPWYEAGHYFPREDITDPPGNIPGSELEPRLWRLDPHFVLEHELTVNDWIGKAR
jgi:iron(III) transport system substrate-binding protein